jgi:hypothetical protein
MRYVMSRILGWKALSIATVLLAAPFLPFACSDSPPGSTSGDGSEQFDGSIDPSGGDFVLQSLETPVPGDGVIRVELVGRNLHFDPQTGQVGLEIAVRNIDSRTLYAPAEVLCSRFQPDTVYPLNPDRIDCPSDSLPNFRFDPSACTFAYGYSELLGADGALAPGEMSGYREWVFHDPGLVAFSFGAAARFALNGERPRISGLFFFDANGNGQHEPDESAFGGGVVEAQGPGLRGNYPVNENGRYNIPVQEPGSYILHMIPPPTLGIAPVRFTTPNPLQVVLTPDANGVPRSFLHADFGITNEIIPPDPNVPPVILIEGPKDSLSLDPYTYLGGSLQGSVLTLRVGFSGCGPDHPFQLYMVGGFMESFPVQARIVLAHDDRGELCDAYWERELQWDLRPIQEAYRQSYGSGGVIRLRFEDNQGQTHYFELEG